MKQPIKDHQLKDMAVPTAELSHHQAQLRRVLVSKAANKKADKNITLQGAINFMKTKTILTGAGVAAMLAIAALTFSAIGPTQNASALQLAMDSSKALQSVLDDKNTAGMSEEEASYIK